MAKDKKSFIAYSDWKETFDKLPDELAGKLIKHIFAYVNDENPISEDFVIEAVFANIKNTLKRDLSKWETQLNQRSEAGKKSALVRKAKSDEASSTKINDRSISLNETTRNLTDSVSVSVSVNDNVTVNESEIITPESRAQISSTHLNEFQKLSIDDCRKKYDLENVNLRNDLGAYLHIKPEEVIILHNNFDLMLKTKEPEKQYNDYTRHFSNWARKLPQDELKQKIKPVSAINSNRIVHYS